MSFRIRGSYFESCNCEAICPCRMVGGVKGGRSTYGVCYGALSWLIDEGLVGEVAVSGLAVALVMRYDDEPGSPWTLALHVDERGSQEQQNAPADVFLGRLSGPHVDTLPWIRKARHLIDVRPSAVELMPEGDGYRLRVGDMVRLRATMRVADQRRRLVHRLRLRAHRHRAVRGRARRRRRAFRVGALRELRLRRGLRVLLVAPL